MDELSIKVHIANRVYPLTVNAQEEEHVRKAAKLIEERIKEMEKTYAVKDKQDVLAMCALQFCTEMLNARGKLNAETQDISFKIKDLEKFLSDYLRQK